MSGAPYAPLVVRQIVPPRTHSHDGKPVLAVHRFAGLQVSCASGGHYVGAPTFTESCVRPRGGLVLRHSEVCTVAVLGVISLCVAKDVKAQREVVRGLSGVVQDSTGEPIPYVQVTLRRAGLRVTDDSGRFHFALDEIGEIELLVRRLGFRPVERTFSEVPDTALIIVMVPTAHSLPSVRAEAAKVARSLELHGFYRRLEEREAGLHSGIFITPEDLERRRPIRASFILEGVPGVRVIRTNSSGTRYGLVGNGNCPMTVYLDGIRLNKFNPRSTSDAYPDLDEVLTPTAVAGVEIYTRRSSIPQGFTMMNGSCGVVLVWTR